MVSPEIGMSTDFFCVVVQYLLEIANEAVESFKDAQSAFDGVRHERLRHVAAI